MNRLIITALCLMPTIGISAQRWHISNDGHSIIWIPGNDIPHEDALEMTGESTSLVLRWGVDTNGAFRQERSLVFPLLRTIPNDTHGSLVFRVATDIPSLLAIDRCGLRSEKVRRVLFDGTLRVESTWGVGWEKLDMSREYPPEIEMVRTIYPSTTLPLACERYVLRNMSSWRTHTVHIPAFTQILETDSARSVDGPFCLHASVDSPGTQMLAPGDSTVFHVIFQAYRKSQEPCHIDAGKELDARKAFIRNDIAQNLILETPDPVLNAEFHFAKLRASESIIRTQGGLMHAPGGEVFYAAVWTNDQCEYAIPFFPFLGYGTGNESAINTFRHYARFTNIEFRPIPSSIICEGLDIWNGAGDRGDAAMCAYGAARYALARANRTDAEELWPLIEWCLEYCRRKLNADGVVESDTDELEGRFPVGRFNLATSCLYYDALLSAADLGRELGKDTKQYKRHAKCLAADIDKFFGREIKGYHAYRYSELNDKLRSWICMPLVVGLDSGRRKGTVEALFGPELASDDGLLTQEEDSVFWDRSTLYAMRGALQAGAADRAITFLSRLASRRLTGDHVPYFIEAWPEGNGSMRQLAAESALYCRIFTEGLFGIRPTGFHSFELTPALPSDWDKASLRHIRAFGNDFDIELTRTGPARLNVTIIRRGHKPFIRDIKDGQTINIKL